MKIKINPDFIEILTPEEKKEFKACLRLLIVLTCKFKLKSSKDTILEMLSNRLLIWQ